MKRSKLATVLGICLAVSMMASACASKKDEKGSKKNASGTSEVTELTEESGSELKETIPEV